MKRTQFKKLLSVVLCLALIAAMALFTAGCSTAAPAPTGSTAATVSDGQTVGEGSVSFPLSIVDKEGNETHVTVNTDKETVGEALIEVGLVDGEQGDYGLYIKSVNGITAIYEEDATYWAFYINGEYAQTGVELTPIVDGESYMLKVEQ